MASELLIGFNSELNPVQLHLKMANRHGLIAGATGTGKTVTLQKLAEGFSKEGVSVFLADVKGDLSGLSFAGGANPKVEERLKKLKIENFAPRANPSIYWDIDGKKGHPLRTTISEMGPLLLSRLLDLNDTQEGVLQIVFKIADDQGLLLLDIKDLRSMITWVTDHASELKSDYGNLATVTLASIQRQVLVLEEAGGDRFFGEPALKLEHILQKDFSGNGVVSVLDASSIMKDPRIYVSFMLYLMSELFEQLPEVGDLDRPKLVFFFDEAHLLFKDAPKVLLEKIEQVVRLIRSKGVGIYFVTQNPLDIPESVLAQLGNRVQHALRAFTPQDQKAVKVAAQTFRQNSSLNTEQVITELGVGEALVSTLDLQGTPSVVERTLIAPPESRIGPLTDAERAEKIQRSPIAGVYDQLIDRESAFELLKKRSEEAEQVSSEKEEKKEGESKLAGLGQAFLKSAAHAVGSSLGRQIMRGVMGSLLGGLTGGGRGRKKSLF